MTPFTPKGEVPEWRMIYDAFLADADFGDVVTYQQLTALLGRSFDDNRGPLYRARSEMGEQRHRWLEVVTGVGYRIIQANEHMRLANGHKRRAKTQLRAMVRVANVTDLARLTESELETFDAQSRINATLAAIAFHHEQRLARVEEVLRREGML